MTETDERWRELRESWESFGHAAEEFGRRVAKDARRFAERVEEHMGDFARDLEREWRNGRPRGSADDVRRVFDEVGGVVKAVLEGVDELVTDLFSPTPESAAPGERWTRTTAERDVQCEKCGKTVASGGEAYGRSRGRSRAYRCVDCGA
jgi:hypothetical protein